MCAAWNMNRVVGLPRGAPQNKPQAPQVLSRCGAVPSRGRGPLQKGARAEGELKRALQQLPWGPAALSGVVCLTAPYLGGHSLGVGVAGHR